MMRRHDPNLKATLTIDAADRVRGVAYVDEYPPIEHARGRDAAAAHLRDLSPTFEIESDALRAMDQVVNYYEPRPQGVEFRFHEEKPNFDTTTYSWYQTFLNTPVWATGLTTTVKDGPPRALAATNSSERGINAKMPSPAAIDRYRDLFRTGDKVDPALAEATGDAKRVKSARRQPGTASLSDLLGDVLRTSKGEGAAEIRAAQARLIRGRFFIYRYDPEKRFDDFPRAHAKPTEDAPGAVEIREADADVHPTLPLADVPDSIRAGRWYLVAELVFRLPWNGRPMNWRMLVEVETNAVLYVRALTSNVNGLVFERDPITGSGNAANNPAANIATLNPLRSSVALAGLTAPAPGANQALGGNFIRISDFEPFTVAPPTRPAGSNFDYDSRTNDFAAVNAYYHCDRFFRLCQSLGFNLGTYFDGTTFPIPVDHRGRFGTTTGIERNASCSGDGDGIANVDFELADLTDTANPMGIAADWRVVLHELGGHGILYDHVGTANFGFAHSAGDSFAVILNDPGSLAADRFESFPWVSFISRRHDRTVAGGWGWGGANDVGSYSSEQILATTHFRVYRSIGGDAADLGRRQFAARCMAYLMLRAVGTLSPTSNPGDPADFLLALVTADNGDWTSEGLAGGAYGKVFTWAFEKQNLEGGARPPVDVYIDDGRAGEYPYQAVHWATTTIWNRRHADGNAAHQEPKLGHTNYAYVKIKNRGTAVANNVVVKAYHCRPSAGVLWPNDLQPMTTPQISAGTLAPNNTEEKIVGPFSWTPVTNAWGHDCMLMIVSANGDTSNVDKLSPGEVYEDWRLVPNDNNVGQRNVTLAPGGGGKKGLIAGLHGKGFWVGNPGRTAANVAVSLALPPLLGRRGWQITTNGIPADGVRLKPRETRLVTFEVHAGSSFTKAEVDAESDRDIVVSATADGSVIGGMVYRIDPELEMPVNDETKEQKSKECAGKAAELLECLDLPSDDLKCVRVRRITIDMEMKDDGCCS